MTRGELKIDVAVMIDGNGRITIDAGQKSRVMNVRGGSTETPVVLKGLTLQNGTTSENGGGIYLNGGTLTTTNVTISNNVAKKSGGGVCVDSSGSFASNDTTISGNKAYGGGGVYVVKGTYTAIDSTICKNESSDDGGGVLLAHSAVDANVAVFTAINTIVSENKASYGAGVYSGSAFTATDSIISGNVASSVGGGVYLWSYTFDATNVTIADNVAYTDGGGVYVGGTFAATDTTIANNTAKREGGGVFVRGTFAATNTTITENSAKKGAGVYDSGAFDATNALIAGNKASESGGGVYVGSSDRFTATNATIADNKASKNGSDVYSDSNASVAIYNSIIALDSGDFYSTTRPTGNANISNYTFWLEDDNYQYDKTRPLFKDAPNGDYRLVDDSQALNKGDVRQAREVGMNETRFDLAYKSRFSGSSIDVGAYEFQEKPNAPTEITFGKYDKANRNITLTWVDNSLDEQNFRVEISSDGKNWTKVATPAANATSSTIAKLDYGAYVVRVRAENRIGASEWTSAELVLKALIAPSDLTLGSYNPKTRCVSMNWKDNSNDETGFRVELSTDDGKTWFFSQNMASNATSRLAWNVKENTTYIFRVCAVRGEEYSEWTYSKTLDTTVGTLVAPSDVTFYYNANTRSATVTWKDGSNDETTFRVERSTNGGKTWRLATTASANVTSRVVRGVASNAPCQFRVCAVRKGERSDWAYSETLNAEVYRTTAANSSAIASNVAVNLTIATISPSPFDVPYSGNYALTTPVAESLAKQEAARDKAFQDLAQDVPFGPFFVDERDVDFSKERADDLNQTKLFGNLFDDDLLETDLSL